MPPAVSGALNVLSTMLSNACDSRGASVNVNDGVPAVQGEGMKQ
jgi:hypothetical protein